MSRLSYGYLVPCCEYAQMPPVPSITQETGGVLEVFDKRNVQRRTHQGWIVILLSVFVRSPDRASSPRIPRSWHFPL